MKPLIRLLFIPVFLFLLPLSSLYGQCSDPNKFADSCDFDGDGILNIDDIDDDNDGVIDILEMAPCITDLVAPNSASANHQFTASGSATPAKMIDGTGLTGSGLTATHSKATISANWMGLHPNTTAELKFYFDNPTNVDRVVFWNPDCQNYGGGDAPAKDFIVTLYYGGDSTVTDTITSDMPTGDGQPNYAQVIDLGTTVSGVDSMKIDILNGWYDVNNNNVDYKSTDSVVVAGTYNLTFSELRVGCGPVDIDTDGDGIPNRFDADSDGDGCSDAYESGARADNIDTIAAPYGANGLADALQNASPDTNTTNYTSTYDLLALSDNLDLCADSDGDGIPDLVDIDDDNDGVLDAVESPACFYTEEEASELTNVSTDFPFNVVTLPLENTYDGSSTTYGRISSTAIADISGMGLVEIQQPTAIELGAFDVEVGGVKLSNGTSATWQLEGWNGSSWAPLSAAQHMNTINTTYSYSNTLNPGVSYSRYRVAGVNGGSVANGRLEEITINPINYTASSNTKAACTADLDGDGLYNHLDPDSDGDGCFDAYESGARANNLDTIAGPYSGNGLADALQATDTNTTNYASTYNPIALSDNLNLCADTDGDGIPDLVDIDDDNDGVLDAVESPGCFSTEEEAGIPKSITSDLLHTDPTTELYDGDNTAAFNFAPSNQDVVIGDAIFKITYNVPVAINSLNITDNVASNPAGTASDITANLWGSVDGITFVNLSASPVTMVTTPIAMPVTTPQAYKYYEVRAANNVLNQIDANTIGEITATIQDYVPSLNPKAACTADLDGDGKYNHLDPDSDGDGCFDAYESGARADNVDTIAGPYSGNGLADALQNASPDTNNTNYTSTYDPIALSDNLNLCADTDGDGIPDLVDIDDDNDGVLDAVESPACFYSEEEASELTNVSTDFPFNVVTLPLENTYDGSSTTYGRISSTAIADISGMGLVEIQQPTAIELGAFDVEVGGVKLSNGTSATWQLEGWNGSSWAPLSAAQHMNTINTTYSYSNTLNPGVSYSRYRVAGVNGGSVANGRLEEITINPINYTASSNTKAACSADQDGDDLYNHLDPDSDGDGCFDAYESGARADNVDTIAGPYSGNGLADALQNASPDTNNTNYTSTYDPIALSDNLNLCADTDGDGIPDLVDIDDDNDGVLDAVESPACFYTEEEASELTNVSTDFPFNVVTLPLENTYDGSSTTYGRISSTAIADISGMGLVEIQQPTAIELGTFDVEVGGVKLSNGTSATWQLEGWNGSSWAPLSAAQHMNTTNTTYSYSNTLNPGVTYSRYRVAGVNGGSVANGRLEEITINPINYTASSNTKAACSADQDGDGLYNHLDPDSDGDGCFDAKEAGLVADNIDTIAAPYGGNGFADALQESSDTNTYDGIYNYGFVTDSTVSACLDTDGDGIADIFDLDDDNDGILDEVETVENCGEGLNFENLTLATLTNGNVFKDRQLTAGNTAYPDVTFDLDIISSSGNLSTSHPELTTSSDGSFAPARGLNGEAVFELTFSQPIELLIDENSSIAGTFGGKDFWDISFLYSDYSYSDSGTQDLNVTADSTNVLAFEGLSGDDDWEIKSKKVSKVRFKFTSTSSQNISPIKIVACTTNDIDTDGDGIPNRLDPDSDGDGCTDAKEAGLVTDNIDTVAAPYGGNGLADGVQKASPDTNQVNYTSTYDSLALDSSKNACLTVNCPQPDSITLEDIFVCEGTSTVLNIPTDTAMDSVLYHQDFSGSKGWTWFGTCADDDGSSCRIYKSDAWTDRGLTLSYDHSSTHRWTSIYDRSRLLIRHLNDGEVTITTDEFTLEAGNSAKFSTDIARAFGVLETNDYVIVNYLVDGVSTGIDTLSGNISRSYSTVETFYENTSGSDQEVAIELKVKNSLREAYNIDNIKITSIPAVPSYIFSSKPDLSDTLLLGTSYDPMTSAGGKDTVYISEISDDTCVGNPVAVIVEVVANGLTPMEPSDTIFCLEQFAPTIDLNSLVGNFQSGGIWTDDDTSGVDLSDSTAVDFSGLVAGEYQFTYTITNSSPCADEIAPVVISILPLPDTLDLPDTTFCAGDQSRLIIPTDTTGVTTLYEQNFVGRKGYTLLGNCTGTDLSTCRRYIPSNLNDRNLTLSGLDGSDLHRWSRIYDGGRMYVAHLNDEEAIFRTDTVIVQAGNVGNMSVDVSRWTGRLEADDYIMFNYIVNGTTVGIDTIYGHMSTRMLTLSSSYDNTAGPDAQVALEVRVKNSLREGHKFDNLKIEQVPQPSTFIFSSQSDLSDTLKLGTSYDPMVPPGTIDTIYVAEISYFGCPGEVDTVIVTSIFNPLNRMEGRDIDLCDTTAAVNLENLVDSFQAGGTWIDFDSTNVDLSDPTNVNFGGLPYGTYSFEYIVDNSPCANEVAVVGINILPPADKLDIPDTTFCAGDQSRLIIPTDTTGVTTLYEQNFVGRKGYTLLGNCTGTDLSTCRRYIPSNLNDRNLTLSGLDGSDLHRWSRIYDGGRMYVAHLNDEEAIFRTDTVIVQAGNVGNMSVDVSRWTGRLEADDYIMFNYIVNGTTVGIDTIYGHMSTRMLTLSSSYDNTAGPDAQVALEVRVKNSLREGHKFDNLKIEQVPQPSTFIFSSQSDLSDTLKLGTSYDPMVPPGTIDTIYVAEISYFGCPGEVDTVIVTSIFNPLNRMEGRDIDLCDTTAAVNLENLVDSFQAGGTWIDFDSTNVDLSDPTNVNFGGLPYGTYSFEYIVDNSPCANEVAVVGINILPPADKLDIPDTTFCAGDQSRLIIPTDTTGVTTLYEQNFVGRKGYTLLGNCTGTDLSTCRRYIPSNLNDRNLTLSGLDGSDLHRWSRIYDGGRMYVAHLNDEEAIFRTDTVIVQAGNVGNMSVDVSRWTGRLEADDYIMFNYIVNGTTVGIDTIYGHMSTRMLTLSSSYDNTAGPDAQVALEVRVKNSLREGHKFDNLKIEQVPQPSTFIFSSQSDLSDTLKLGTSYDPMVPPGTIDTIYVAEISYFGCPGEVDTVIVTSIFNPLNRMEGRDVDIYDTTIFVNLEHYIDSFQAGGTWIDFDSTNVDLSDPTNVNFGGLPYGTYSFEYIVDNSPCANEVAVVGVNILPIILIPEDSIVTVCPPATSSVDSIGSMELACDPNNGTTSIDTATGCVTYKPDTNFVGTDTICIVTCDTNDICDTTVTILTVTPVIDTLPITIPEDSTIAICPPATSSVDSIGSMELACDPNNGTTSIDTATGCVTYKPDTNFVGTDTICIVTCDTNDICDTTVTILTVTPVIDTLPITIPEDSSVTVCPPATSSVDTIGSMELACDPNNGTTSIDTATGCVTYKPDTNFVGTDTICIVTCDTNDICDTTITILTVTPVIDTLPITIPEDSSVTVCPPATSSVDTIGSMELACDPNNGTTSIDTATGCVTYKPDTNFVGTDTICIVTCDTNDICDTTITILTVTPVIDTLPITIPEDSSVTVCPPATSSVDTIGSMELACDPNNGTTTIDTATGCVTYKPDTNFVGTDTICIVTCDTNDICDTTITILTVTPVIDTLPITIPEDSSVTVCPPATSSVDTIGSMELACDPNNGTTSIDTATGCVTYKPDTNFVGTDTICIVTCDTNDICDTTITILTVTPVIDTLPITIPEDSTIAICPPATSSVDSIGSMELACDPNNGTTSIDTATGCVTYKPDTNFVGTDTICIVTCDTNDICDTTVTILTVTPVIDTLPITIPEDSTIAICPPATSSVDSIGSMELACDPNNGTTTIDTATGCVTYKPDTNFVGTDTICIVTCDTNDICDTTITILTVTPVIDTLPITIPEDSTIAICPPATSSVDSIGSMELACDPNNGTTTIDTATGCVTYKPDTNFVGTDTICIVTCDTNDICDTTVTILTVTPVIDTLPITIPEDSSVTVCPPATSSVDTIGSMELACDPNNGTTSIDTATGCVTYKPDTNFVGTDTICIVTCDTNDICDTTVTILTVTPVIDTLPITIPEDSSVTVCPPATSSVDTIGSMELACDPNNGTTSIDTATGCVTYKPDTNFVGTDTICIVTCDTNDICDTTITILTVTPVIDTLPITIPEDSTIAICPPATSSVDSIGSMELACDPNNGTTSIDTATGCVTYKPDTNFVGTDTICIVTCDTNDICDTTVTILTVTPVIDTLPITIPEDSTIAICPPATSSVDSIGSMELACDPNNGTTTIDTATGCVTYKPDTNFVGTDTICIVTCDTNDICDTTITILTVTPVIDTLPITIPEDSTIAICPPATSSVDSIGSMELACDPNNGTTTIDTATGCVTYKPDTNFVGTDTICIVTCDTNDICDTTVTILTVTPVIDTLPITIPEDSSVTVCPPATSSVDTIGSMELACDPNNGTTSIDTATGCVTYKPDTNFVGTDTICIVTCDTNDICDTTVTILTVTPVIDTLPITIPEDSSVTVCPPATSSVDTIGSMELACDPNNGTTSIDTATGCVTYKPDTNFVGTDTICIVTCDTNDICDTTITILTVTPVIDTLPITIPEDSTIAICPPATSSVDSIGSMELACDPNNGTTTIDTATGCVTYKPDTNFVGTDTICIVTCDTNDICDTTVTILTVTPVIDTLPITIPEDSTIAICPPATSSVDSIGSMELACDPNNGTTTIDTATGCVTYKPDTNFVGTDTICIVTCDTNDICDTTITILTVTPVIDTLPITIPEDSSVTVCPPATSSVDTIGSMELACDPNNGTTSIDTATGCVTYKPDTNFVGTDTICIVTCDTNDICDTTITILTVTPVIDTLPITIPEDSTIAICPPATSSVDSIGSMELACDPNNGTTSIDTATGCVTYKPETNFVGTDTICIVTCDTNDICDTTVTILTVTPVIDTLPITIPEDSTIAICPPATSSVDSIGSMELACDPNNGTTTIDTATGCVTYKPDTNFVGTDTICIVTCDTNDICDTTITILTVTPVIDTLPITIPEDSTIAICPPATSSVDSIGSMELACDPNNGTTSIDTATGCVTYKPDTNFVGTDTICIVTCDTNDICDTTVTILTVTPVIDTLPITIPEDSTIAICPPATSSVDSIGSMELACDPNNGTTTIDTATGCVTYKPDTNFVGTDTICIVTCDTNDICDTTITILTVTPVIDTLPITIPEDSTIAICPPATSSVDSIGSMELACDPNNGTTTIDTATGCVTYKPDTNFVGTDTICIVTCDTNDICDTTVTILTVTPVIDTLPITIPEDSTIAICPPATSSVDSIGSMELACDPNNGTTSIDTATGCVTYKPDTNFVGTDTICIVTCDTNDICDTTITILTVTPVIDTLPITIPEDSTIAICPPATSSVDSIGSMELACDPNNGTTTIDTATGCVTYKPDTNFVGTDTICIVTCDTNDICDTTVTILTVTPVIDTLPITIPEDSTIAICPPATSSVDSIGSMELACDPNNGTTSIDTATGCVTYKPDTNFVGTDTICIVTCDTNDICDTTVTILTVTPVIDTLPITIPEDSTIAICPPATSSVDSIGSMELACDPNNGTTTIDTATGCVTYKPDTNFVGTDTICIVTCDTNDICDTTITILTVTPVIDTLPITIPEDSTIAICPPATSSVDSIGSMELACDPNNGTTTIDTATGCVTYKPDTNFVGTDTICIVTCDTNDICDTTVTILTVTPVIDTLPITIPEDSSVTVCPPATSSVDTIGSMELACDPNNGTTSIDTATGCVTYKPDTNFVGTDTICIVTCDTNDICDTTITILTVTPVIDTLPITIPEDSTIAICPPATSSVDSIGSMELACDPNNGTTSIDTATGCVTYKPDTNFVGTDTICIVTCDTNDICDTTVTILTVTPVIDTLPITIPEDSSVTVCPPATSSVDTIGSMELACDPNNGTTTIDTATGCVTYKPDTNFVGTDTICIVTCDTNDICDTTITILTVTPVIDTLPITIPEDSTIAICPPATSSVDSIGSMELACDPNNGTTTIDTATGCVTYKPDTNFVGTDTICIVTCDTNDICDTTVTILTVTPVIDTLPITIPEDSTIAICPPATSSVDSIGSMELACDPNNGTTTIDTATGCVTYKPDTNFVGTDTICIVTCDTNDICDTTVTILTVTPVIDTLPITIPEDSTIAICPPATSSVDSIGSMELACDPNNGTTSIDTATGCVTYKPDTNFVGTDTICIVTCDTNDICDTTITILTVTPVIDTLPITIPEDSTIAICPPATSSVDSIGSMELACDPNNGTTTIDTATGCVTYKPDTNFVGTDTICIVTCDTNDICDTTVTILTVTPVIDTLPITIPEDSTIAICPPATSSVDSIGSMELACDPNNGTTSIDTATGCVTYKPDTNFVGTDTICIVTCDTNDICDTTVTILTVTPVIDTLPITMPEDSSVTVCPPATSSVDTIGSMELACGPNNGTTTIDTATGCVTYKPDTNYFGIDTMCVVICDTNGICDTTVVIITVEPVPYPDTFFVNIPKVGGIIVCGDTSEFHYPVDTYNPCGGPLYGSLTRVNANCYNYISSSNTLDTACVVICDASGECDTTIFIFIPYVINDTIITTDTVICVDTNEMPNGFHTISTCGGFGMTNNGGIVSTDSLGCASITPNFGSGLTDTTCIVICDSVLGICDTTIIVSVKPTTIDTITLPVIGGLADTCINTKELIGSYYTYHSCSAPVYGMINNSDSCYQYTSSNNYLDTACVVVCDEFGICDTTVFVFIPSLPNDTIITIDTIVCLDTTEMPNGFHTISTCDGLGMTNNGGNVGSDTRGCITITPSFGSGLTDTTCIVICDTVLGICDTTIIVSIKPPTRDTIKVPTGGVTTNLCISTEELLGNNFDYYNCGLTSQGILTNYNDTCFQYIPLINNIDTACVVICNEFGVCDTTLIVFIPPVTPDTIYTTDSVVCVDTTELSSGYNSITGCDGSNPARTSNGGYVSIDNSGCVTITPDFHGGLTDTTCIIVCDTTAGICDTTIIVSVRKAIPDTIYQCIPRNGQINDSNMNTNDLLGSNFSTSFIKTPQHGQFNLYNDTLATYQTSPSPILDTVVVSICDEYNFCDTFTFIYIPPMNNDTIYNNGGIVQLDTSEMPDNKHNAIATCDGLGMTSNGGSVVFLPNGKVDITPNFSSRKTDTTCIVICDTILPMCECDTTYIVSFKPTTPDTFAIVLPSGTNTADTCLTQDELCGTSFTYNRIGAPTPHGPVTIHNDTCINYVQTSTTKYLDTARVQICDEYGMCDTTVIIYIPSPDNDTIVLGPVIPGTNVDTCVSLESSFMTARYVSTCDGSGTSANGIPVTITGLCVRYPVPNPVFNGDTTCIVVCDTIQGLVICDSTLIVYLPDTTPPTVICKDDTVYLNSTGSAMIDTSNVLNSVHDNTLINAVWMSNNSFNCSNVGTNSVTVFARDTNRNTSSCTATITVLDTIAPIVVCQNITIQLDSNGNAAIIALDIDGGSSDNCAIANITISKSSFDCSNVGHNSVTLTITDIHGNSSSCTAIVTIEDNIAPTASCPDDMNTVIRNTNCTYVVEDFTHLATFTDNCDDQDVTVSQLPTPGTEVILENESATITITTTDAGGNSQSCSFEVYARCNKALDIPQFISPNGDGANDTWEITELINYPDNTVKVFNRWGNLVFEQKGYLGGWGGNSNVDKGVNRLVNSKILPDGTYYYIIDLGVKETQPYVGYMQINR